ncbi:nucleotidyltransferase family protein [Sulfitobacter sp.]|uniref:nucleotidyltransferase family protein n=1 Tax=Sulfitobacter sp. TaxID=1903071 RepID=UPI003001B9A8
MIPIVILAAGASSRMQGRDKLLELVDGVALLRRQVQRALATGAQVLVTLPALPHPRYEALADLDVGTVLVPDAAEGMNASLRAGLAAVPQDADAVMILLADMPDITISDINTMIQAVNLNSNFSIWRATTDQGDAGHPIVFHKSLLPELLTLTGDAGGAAVVKANKHRTKLIALPDAHARTDLDTPEAWTAWRAARDVT